MDWVRVDLVAHLLTSSACISRVARLGCSGSSSCSKALTAAAGCTKGVFPGMTARMACVQRMIRGWCCTIGNNPSSQKTARATPGAEAEINAEPCDFANRLSHAASGPIGTTRGKMHGPRPRRMRLPRFSPKCLVSCPEMRPCWELHLPTEKSGYKIPRTVVLCCWAYRGMEVVFAPGQLKCPEESLWPLSRDGLPDAFRR